MEADYYRTLFDDTIRKYDPQNINATDVLSSLWFQSNECETDLYLDIGRQTASALFQVIFIQIYLSNNIFSILESLWKSKKTKNHCILVSVLLVALTTQIANHTAYFHSPNIGLHLLFLFLFTPGSVLSEWAAFRLLKAYIEWSFRLVTASIRYFSTKITKDRVIQILSSLVHTEEELDSVHEAVSDLVEPIRTKLATISRHEVEVIPTGSVFERYGKSLTAADALESNLKTDFDVMFVVSKSSLQVETLVKNCEFLHIFVLTDRCNLLNIIKKKDTKSQAFKLSAVQAKEFMGRVVRSSQLDQEGARPFKRFLCNLLVFQINLPRLSRSRYCYSSLNV